MAKNILGFSAAPNMQRVLECGGRYAAIMRADKKISDDGRLPPGTPIPCLAVDYLKDRPNFWVGGQGSFVCPVDSEWGLWFNWTMNNPDNTAVLTSVKGMNPITGQRISGLGLEQYVEKCPIHGEPFKHGRLCEKCGFKWPDQNYVTDPLYLDGFRNSDGTVRQFYFTEDMAKSIPELVIGKEDTVPAFGFCLYGKKSYKPNFSEGNRIKNEGFKSCFRDRYNAREYSGLGGMVHPLLDMSRAYMSGDIPLSSASSSGCSESHSTLFKGVSKMSYCADALVLDSATPITAERSEPIMLACFASATEPGAVAEYSADIEMVDSKSARSFGPVHKSAEVGVGAGAEINQAFLKDLTPVEDWQEKPAAVFRVYFVFQEEFERYVGAGLNDLSGVKEGFMSDLPVGVQNAR